VTPRYVVTSVSISPAAAFESEPASSAEKSSVRVPSGEVSVPAVVFVYVFPVLLFCSTTSPISMDVEAAARVRERDRRRSRTSPRCGRR
jgi:hypothetical protein